MKLSRFIAVLLAVMLLVSGVSVFNAAKVYASDDEVIQIPDANLKKALLGKGLDSNGDGELTRGEMANFGLKKESGITEFTRLGITNLSGMGPLN
ncbi:hypothetical protein EHS13_04360 [Paenibacillus psychroresistens]|uniref:EF-hand domain-containing protein n=1 Tax=Paenibacillus psychroresistens TaxID=1778678 RepID=A0A6B8REN7_9BACL|nr:hypothetical protein EHS13_04360 [Paenibacillus psychroresistens]